MTLRTAVYHYILESFLTPLYGLVPVVLEDRAVDREKKRFGDLDGQNEGPQDEDESARPSIEQPMSVSDTEKRELTSAAAPTGLDGEQPVSETQRPPPESTSISKGAANARRVFSRLNKTVAARLATAPSHVQHQEGRSRKMELADELGASLAGYPDELTRLTPRERDAELSTAYQDPVTREPPPVSRFSYCVKNSYRG